MTAFRRDYLVRLPLPLAQLYSRSHNARDARCRHDNAYYLFETLVKLMAAPAIAAYLHELDQGRPRVPALDQQLLQLALPSFGQWVGMLRELTQYFGSRADAPSHPLGRLAEQLNEPRRDRPAVLALFRRIKNGVDGHPGADKACTLLQLFDGLVQYRNGVFGHSGPRESAFYENKMGPLLFPAATEVLAEGVLDVLGPPGSRLIYLTELRLQGGGRVEALLRELVGLQGERASPLLLSVEQAAGLAPNRLAVQWPGQPVPLRLDPLLVYRENKQAEEVLFLNRDRNGRKVEYLSYTTGRTEQDPSTSADLAALLGRLTGRPVSEEALQKLAEQSRSQGALVEKGVEPAPSRSGKPPLALTLTVIQGPTSGLAFTFPGHATFLVGRSPDAHFRFPERDRSVSRLHFLIEVNPPLCRLVDLHSRRGTFVNGQQVQTADLKDGDQIGAGQSLLHVAFPGVKGGGAAAPVSTGSETLGELVSQAAGLTGTAFGEFLRADQEQRWLRGAGLPVEIYLGRLPALREQADLFADLIYNEVLLREEGGDVPQVEEYLRRLPRYAAEIQRLFQAHQILRTPSLRAPAPPVDGREPFATGFSFAGGDPFATGMLADDPAATGSPAGGHARLLHRTPAFPSIPGYEILRELGRGGMGVVHQARRQADSSLVAIKALLQTAPDNRSVARFLREVDVLKVLSHPHIVAFREMGHVAGRIYFIMDYIEGCDASRLLREQGPLPVRRAVEILCQLLEALAYAHEKGFVHRDVKPSNLLLTREGSREVVKLADFGLAKAYQQSPLSGLTLTGSTGGTPAYMPPEQVLDFRSSRPAADQYAAAATLYELLTGRWLYDEVKAPTDLLLKKLSEEPVPIRKRQPQVPEKLAQVIHRALARQPEKRFADVTAFRLALAPWGTDGSQASRTK